MDNNVKYLALSIIGLIVIAAGYVILIQSAPQGPVAQPYVSNLTILSSNGSNINGIFVINGVVHNNNPFNITVINLNASGYNSSGKLVDTGDGFTTTSPIVAGGTANFTISLYDPQKQVMTYVVQVEDASK
jgi:LEA14-like dessication related protein